MVKADLHLHSKHSNHPSDWFLQRLGTAESYIEPDFAYEKAKEEGMDFVTLTDHNSIEGSVYLKSKHPESVFTGVESTVYFPEDGCKVHILVYGLDQNQFEEIERLRTNIYLFRDYIKMQRLPYSVAHATYSVDGKITKDHLEKLILLFDVFEGINGGRNKRSNLDWFKLLRELTPEDMDKLYRKHQIVPFSKDPWNKGITGGSDDHAGLFLGQSYTVGQAKNMEEFLECLRNKETFAEGRHNDYKGLAFTVYKIAMDFARKKQSFIEHSPLGQFARHLFTDGKVSLADRLKIRKLQSGGNPVHKIFGDFIQSIQAFKKKGRIDQKLDVAYDQLAKLSDQIFKDLFKSIHGDLKEGDLGGLAKNVSSSLLGIFVTLPFITTFKHMFNTRGIVSAVRKDIRKKEPQGNKKILWFTDTMNDLNGVSMTLKTIGWLAYEKKKDIRFITSLLPRELDETLPPDVISLPAIYDFALPNYEKLTIKIPSLLTALKAIYQYDPDEIFISSPGPLGLLGILASKLLNIKCSVVYHTDFTMQARDVIGEESIVSMIETYMKWFHEQADSIMVPTREYMRILEGRGWDRAKMKLFRRGIDQETFAPAGNTADGNTFQLLYAGRVSKDKNLDFLFDVYTKLKNDEINVSLSIAGDGPYLPELKEKYGNMDGVTFLGKVRYSGLPILYSGSDLFVFPSLTDTFGMVVLEAQSCGLPCIVSDIGGPQEIIEPDQTGFVLSTASALDWVNKIETLIQLKDEMPEYYQAYREASRKRILLNFNWDSVFSEWLEENESAEPMVLDKLAIAELLPVV